MTDTSEPTPEQDSTPTEVPTETGSSAPTPEQNMSQPDATTVAETSETKPLYAPHPDHVAATAFTTQPASPASATQAPRATAERKSSSPKIWVAGIAIGALVGGVVGGGAAALVMSNQPTLSYQSAGASGTLTLDNLDNATNVSAVAAVGSPSVVTLEVKGDSGAGSGSGVIYSEDGYIVTNAHVVTLDGDAGDNPEVHVWLTDGRILSAKVVGVDPFADLAVVKVDAKDLTPMKVANSNDVRVGDLAVAIGAPLNLSNTVTSGVVSALNRGITVGSTIVPDESDDDATETPEGENGFPWFEFGDPGESEQQQPKQQSAALTVTLPVIQTDASINPGNSGGALLNSNAELIGINVAIASNASDSASAGSVGLGFAIPSNMVTRVADSLIAGKKPSHGLLGVNISDAGSGSNKGVAGALIEAVSEGGAAEKAGLKAGDVITAIDGIRTDSGTTASALVRMNEGGNTVTVTFIRDGKQQEAEVTLGTLDWQ